MPASFPEPGGLGRFASGGLGARASSVRAWSPARVNLIYNFWQPGCVASDPHASDFILVQTHNFSESLVNVSVGDPDMLSDELHTRE